MNTKVTKATEIAIDQLTGTTTDANFQFIYLGLGTAANPRNPGKPLEFFTFAAKDPAAPQGADPLTFKIFGSRYLTLEDGDKLMPKGKLIWVTLRASESTKGITYYNVVGFEKI
jgi:hypothetical protein